jgi:hypothetical protein
VKPIPQLGHGAVTIHAVTDSRRQHEVISYPVISSAPSDRQTWGLHWPSMFASAASLCGPPQLECRAVASCASALSRPRCGTIRSSSPPCNRRDEAEGQVRTQAAVGRTSARLLAVTLNRRSLQRPVGLFVGSRMMQRSSDAQYQPSTSATARLDRGRAGFRNPVRVP